MNRHYELVVIGAGPAGMAAATQCGAAGIATLLLDEQPGPGGQIYRGLEQPVIMDREVLGEEYHKGEALIGALRQARIDYVASASVWQISPKREIGVSVAGESRIITADRIIIATGAQERPFPIPGWTLPGVMTAGAAQILLKKSGMVGEGAVFAGTGPLLYLTARQYLNAGAKVTAVVDTKPFSNYWRALSHAAGGLSGLKNLRKGWRWMQQLRDAGIPIIDGVTDLRVRGEKRVRGIDYLQDGVWKALHTDHVFLHQGVVPNINLTMSMGCAHAWCDRQLCWRVVTDEWGATSLPGVAVTGDAADIGGAVCAQHRGAIAALGAIHQLGHISEQERDATAAPHRHAMAAEEKFRPFLDVLFQPSKQFLAPADQQVLVCRCEELTAGKLRDTIAVGCEGPNTLKSFTRCGMGPCQGRMCGLTVTQMLSTQLGRPMTEVGYYRVRQPIKPIALGELASLADTAAAVADVPSHSKVTSP